MANVKAMTEKQGQRNDALLNETHFLGRKIASDVFAMATVPTDKNLTLGEA